MRSFMLTLLATTVFLSGCQTAMHTQAMASGQTAISCEQIRGAFSAYEADRESATALSTLMAAINPEAGTIASQGVRTSDQYYEQIRASTNLTLATQGCQPLGY